MLSLRIPRMQSLQSITRRAVSYRSHALHALTNSGVYRYFRFRWPMYGVCRWNLNRASNKLYRNEKVHLRLGSVQQRIVSELLSDGLSVVHFNELFPNKSLSDFTEAADALMREPRNQARVKAIREGKTSPSDFKFYLVHLLGYPPAFSFNDNFLQLSLSQEVHAIACAYLGTLCRLVQVDLWCNVPTQGPSLYSQRWHRDPDDKRILKLFLYLRDVNEGNGPLNYIPKTQNGGRFSSTYRQTMHTSIYPGDAEVAERFSKEQVKVITGRAGTLVLCDTTGLHRGGHPTHDLRVLFHSVYTTNAGVSFNGTRYSLVGTPNQQLTVAEEYAIGHLNQSRSRNNNESL